MAGYTGAGATIGGFAGGGVGALGFAGGPVGLATTPTFSAGGAALGGGIGGLSGMIACSSGTGQGGGSGQSSDGGQAPLTKLHNDSTLSKTSLEFWRKKSTQEVVDSPRPGNSEALRVKPDGTIMNGNTRITVLQERGFDVNSLPRELH